MSKDAEKKLEEMEREAQLEAMEQSASQSSDPLDDIGITQDQPWYKDVGDFIYDMGVGAGKGAIGTGKGIYETAKKTNPAIGAWDLPLSKLGLNFSDEELQPQGLPEAIGGAGWDLAAFLSPAKGEAQLGRVLEKGTANLPKMARAPINIAGKSAIGGASGYGVSTLLGDEDPESAGMWSAIFPGLTALSKETGLTQKVFSPIWKSARNSMARALEPGTWYDKWAAENILDPLLKRGKMWFSREGLEKTAGKEISESAARREAVAPAADSMVDWDVAKHILEQERDATLRSGNVGGMFVNGQWVPGKIPMGRGPEAENAANALDDYIERYMFPHTAIDPATGRRVIPFNDVDAAKVYMQNIAATKNAFLGAPEETLANKIVAYETGSNALRPFEEVIAGPEWAKENEIMSIWEDILKLAKKSSKKQLGKPVPLAEQSFLGFGAHLGTSDMPVDKSLIIRALRHLTHTPAWNSLQGITKARVAETIAQTSGFSLGQIAAWASGRGDESEEEPEEELEPGTKVNLEDPAGLLPFLKK